LGVADGRPAVEQRHPELAGSYARVRELADKLLDGLSAKKRADPSARFRQDHRN
jgi:hypothetical protein